MLLGKRPQKDLVRKYEDFLKDNFFDGQEVDITSHEGNKSDYTTLYGI